MKSKAIFLISMALVISACEKENAAIKDELQCIEITSKNLNQPEEIRISARTFADILSQKDEIPRSDLSKAHWGFITNPNPTVILTYVSFLQALEKQIPANLPAVEVYQAMKGRAGKAEFVEYTLGQTVVMISKSIQNISLYGDPSADEEIEGVLRRIEEKHGNSETGKKIVEFLKMVRQQGLSGRSMGLKPWESPKKLPGAVD